jgi:undecaprenyl-phosphate alpha-N-acetylglucosaminyl 1-phosphatetransferase/UDP-N-acetylglucosamine 2-epimerase
MLDAKLVAAGSVALTVTLIAIFSLRPLAPRLGLIDRPDERKRHRGHVPLIGGLCFFIGMVAGVGYLQVQDDFVVCLLVTGAAILLTGLIDDMYDLSVRTRLIVQAGMAAVVIAATGVYVDSLGQFFGTSDLRIHALGIPLTIVAVVGLINAFNMLDGIDGLAGGLAMICILSIVAFAMGTGWQTLGILMLLQILLVALVPYVSVNLGWPDGRKIFMGDAGSTAIGFLLAWSLIFLSQREVGRLAPVDVLWCIALPIMDTVAVMMRRISQGRSPFKADRQHVHHLVLDAGYSPRAALGLIVATGGLLAAVGYTLRNVPDLLNLAIFLGVFALYVSQLPRGLSWLAGISGRTPVVTDAVVAAFGAETILSFDGGVEAVAHQHTHEPQRVPLRALCVLGEAPDAVNVALVAQRLLHDRRFDTRICVTDLASETQRRVLELFDVRPDIRLDVGQPNADPTDIASATLNGMKRVLAELKPDVVLVHGDTSATLAATLAACYRQIPVARLESAAETLGAPALSSGEQINRRLASALASVHFTPSESAVNRLVAAGIPRDRITMTGDPAIETLRAAVERIREDGVLQRELARRFAFLRPNSPLLLVTHRDQIAGFAQLGRALRKVARKRPDIDIVYPIAMTPDAQKGTQLLGWRPDNVHLVEPLDYLAFAYLLQSAYLVLTGSSEVESEAAMLGKPVLVLRETATQDELATERLNSIAVEDSAIADGVMTLLNDQTVYDAMRLANEKSTGYDACFRIVDALASIPARNSALAA